MAEAVADVIKESSHAAEVVAKPGVALAVIAIVAAVVAIGGCGWLVYKDEIRADEQIRVLQAMSQHIADLDGDFRAAGVPVGQTKAKRLAVQASSRSEAE